MGTGECIRLLQLERLLLLYSDAVFECRGIFIDVNIGWPGKIHDASVFTNSSCYRKGSVATLFPDWSRVIGGVSIPLVILGDPAYPLLPWLLKPYLENCSTTHNNTVTSNIGRAEQGW